MNILIDFNGMEPLKHDAIGDIIILELEKEGFSLFYNDIYDYYSTIDFRKEGYKFNVMLVPKEQCIECSTSVYKNLFSILFKNYNKEKVSLFSKLIKSILVQKGIIKGTTN
jgi:hypothetical protein